MGAQAKDKHYGDGIDGQSNMGQNPQTAPLSIHAVLLKNINAELAAQPFVMLRLSRLKQLCVRYTQTIMQPKTGKQGSITAKSDSEGEASTADRLLRRLFPVVLIKLAILLLLVVLSISFTCVRLSTHAPCSHSRLHIS